MTLSPRAKRLEREQGKPRADALRDTWAKHPSYRKCAKALEISVATLYRYLAAEGLRPGKNKLRPGLARKEKKARS